MALTLNENWRLSSSGLDWVLERKGVTKAGNEVWAAKGYYPSISIACESFLAKRLLMSDGSWQEIAETTQEALLDIRQMCDSIKNIELSTAAVDTVDNTQDLNFLD